ncbi:hypothetical protein ACFV3R_00075 [Streptomyces sp. NPDC059740]|uniref:hypothetical protein n=1 Tax=Streptomyces sp. NPDC059740 TaxID=3346926 RepID=UPI003647A627
MGSLRNPIGPLPSAIYWRRRAVALVVLALLAALVVWAVSLGGNDGSDDRAKGPGGGGPAPSITPGPSGSGTTGGGTGGGDTGGSGGSGGSGGGSGGGGGAGGAASGSGGGSGSGGSGTGGAAAGAGGPLGVPLGKASGDVTVVPSDSSLPDCGRADTTVKLTSRHASYHPDQKPVFEVTVANRGDKACKVNLGRTSATLTISPADHDQAFWDSGDCPSDTRAALVRVAADGSVKRIVTWDRAASDKRCSTASPEKAAPGHYRAKLKVSGMTAVTTTFTLTGD